jgi:hypothetical protein
MKNLICLLTTFAVVSGTFLYAGPFVPYNDAKAPSLSLPDAYERAMVALGSKTNQLHCVNASVQSFYGADGEWLFTFYSTNSPLKPKWVTVEFNGKIHVEDLFLR